MALLWEKDKCPPEQRSGPFLTAPVATPHRRSPTAVRRVPFWAAQGCVDFRHAGGREYKLFCAVRLLLNKLGARRPLSQKIYNMEMNIYCYRNDIYVMYLVKEKLSTKTRLELD
jgi:hypothetical protein